MNRLIFCSIIGLLVINDIVAQQLQGKALAPLAGRRDISEMAVVDTGYVRISYAFNAHDINDPQSYIDLQYLEVGKHLSKYYSYFVFNNDSLVWNWIKNHPDSEGGKNFLGPLGKMPYYWSEYKYSEYFKDYETNLLTEYARMPHPVKPDRQYSEAIPIQNWEILKDTLMINGYLCQKATCHFRGRTYTVWFTMDIPISNGPWKLGGLPGLILKVFDDDLLYTFECVKIEKGKFPIKKYDFRSYKLTKREKLLEIQKELNINFIKTSGGRVINGRLPQNIPYEPLELY